MKKLLLWFCCLASIGFILPLNTQAGAQALVTVNGEAITGEKYNAFVRLQGFSAYDKTSPADRDMILEVMLNRELLYQAAQKQNIGKDPKVEIMLQNFDKNFQNFSQNDPRAKGLSPADSRLLQAAMKQEFFIQTLTERLKSKEVNEAELQALYQRKYKSGGSAEYQVQHILVADEKKAREIIALLKTGGDFAQLAQQHSVDMNAKSGGDLGWNSAEVFPTPFKTALISVKSKSHSETPVKTTYGWHVIYKGSERSIPQPDFAGVKDRLQRVALDERVNFFLGELKNKAKVQWHNNKEKN